MAKRPIDQSDELSAEDGDARLDISPLEALRAELSGKWDAAGDYAKYKIAQRLREEMASWPGGPDALGEALLVMRRRQQYPVRSYDSDAEVARSLAYLMLDLDPKRGPVVARAIAAVSDSDADETVSLLIEAGGFAKLAARGKADAVKAARQAKRKKAEPAPNRGGSRTITVLTGRSDKRR